MRDAETVLGIIRERGRRGLPLEQVYRQLFNPALYLRAYGRIARNHGATTPGVTAETADGMSLAKIQQIIEQVRFERYRWSPARRVYIEKQGSKKMRPLGVPTWSDKLLQEVVRSILEAYYEPQFSRHSHGFRPGRGCHTALQEIRRTWHGVAWFIEGDIAACFDSLDHEVLLTTLAEKIHDGRFIRLIGGMLKAGYLEDWKFNATLSGSPQGGVASPILSNIYLDRLDSFVEQTLLPVYNRGARRQPNPEYQALTHRAQYLRRKGRHEDAETLRKQYQQLPSGDPNDPDYRRLWYVRYADDWLLGFNGPRTEAADIKRQLGEFLRDHLKLELSESKTLITHARSGAARFLGYEVTILHCDTKHDQRGRRSINGGLSLRVPTAVIRAKMQPYMKNGKPVHRPERLHDSVYSIVEKYQMEYRGVVEYYRMAHNLPDFDTVRWVMETSLLKTLASKLRISVTQAAKRFKTSVPTDQGPRKVLRVVVERGPERAPLVAQWGGISLKWRIDAVLNDQPPQIWNIGTDLLQRLLGDTCELCGSHDGVQVHHVKALKDLQPQRSGPRPEWVKVMIARRRKTLVVCHECHEDVHHGRHRRQPAAASDASLRRSDTAAEERTRGHRRAG
jgi:group II intron reverse transcriptase/maturase